MNEEEINLVNKTVELWNDFIKLPELYKNDRQYVQYHIDAIQAIIMQNARFGKCCRKRRIILFFDFFTTAQPRRRGAVFFIF